MSFEQMDIPFGKKKNDETEKALNEYGVVLNQDEKMIIRNLLGTREQVFKKVEAVLEALDRNQAGSFKIGTPAFYNSMIEAGGRKISSGEFNLCKKVLNKIIEIIQTEWQKEEDDKTELDKIVTKHFDEKNPETLIEGARLNEEKESERTGINPEDFNNL